MSEKDTSANQSIPLVGLCASAGGIQALKAFFAAMPVQTGITFVVMTHLNPDNDSLLVQVLQRETELNVREISDGMTIEAGLVYVLPAGLQVMVEAGKLHLEKREPADGWPRTMDIFLQSLAAAYGQWAAALVFSGFGDDAREGARAIKEADGLVIGQSLETAQQKGMPESISKAGLADAMLNVEDMPRALLRYYDIPVDRLMGTENLSESLTDEEIDRILRRLQRQIGRDFHDYKQSTVRRQIARRIGIHRLETAEDYLTFMERHPTEAEQLGRYLLINVTRFFREPDAFETLKQEGLMPLLREFNIDDSFRVWVPGCATGEEAVSIAIVIYECLQALDKTQMSVRIFATDANPEPLRIARAGLYSRIAVVDMTPERLAANFVETADGYRVRNHISRMMVWSEHNLIEHPPFSNIQLISCRNVLIYFQPRLQKQVLALFQFALKEGGLLFLGSSETMPQESSGFATLSSRHRVYQWLDGDRAAWIRLDRPRFLGLPHQEMTPHMTDANQPEREDDDRELSVIKELLLTHHDSTCVIIDENYQVRYTYGEIDRYLRVLTGKDGQKAVLDMAREGLGVELTVALHQAIEADHRVVRRGVWLRTNGDERIIDLTVQPIPADRLPGRRWLLIFDLVVQGQDLRDTPAGTAPEHEGETVKRLQSELQETRQTLQNVTTALQAKGEELATSLEEVRSASEEVQTTNEELLTSKEELESMNEELNTLNTQLTDQNDALIRANNTLHNFLQSTEIGMIFLDQTLNVREFTSAVTPLFSLRASDEGRPLAEVTNRLSYDQLVEDCNFVLDTLTNVEKEIHTQDGDHWYDMKIRPYRTVNHIVDGLVLTFADITAQKQAQFESEAQTAYVRQIFDAIEHSLLELNGELEVFSANQQFYESFRTTEGETVGRKLYELGNGQWDIPELRYLLNEVIPEESIVRDYTVTHDFPQLGKRTMHLNAQQIAAPDRILLVITDISDE